MLSFKRLMKVSNGYKRYFVGAFVTAGLAVLFSLLAPMVVSFTIDNVIGGRPMNYPRFITDLVDALGGTTNIATNLWICATGVVIATGVNSFFSYLRGRWTAVASEGIAKDIKNNLYDHLQNLPYDYHVKAKTGDLIQRCTSDVETIRRFFAGQLVEIIRTLFIVGLSMAVMLSINVKLALLAIIVMPLVFVFSYVFFRKISQTFTLVDEKEGELQTVLQENLSGVRVVRAFGRQRYEVDKFEHKNSEFRLLVNKLVNLMAAFWATSDLLCLLQISLVLFVGVYFVVKGQLTLGNLLMFTTYEGMLVFPLRHLGRILSDMGKMTVSIDRVYEILNTPLEENDPSALKPELNGDIVFNDVHFAYEASNPVLNGLTLTVKRGETVAFLGSTGSGKSSVMHLLLRLYEHEKGSITINGVDIKRIDKKWLRRHIGIVLQDPFLYSKTIRNNVRMARSDVKDMEIYEAAKTASVHDVIEGFREGYETMVGEKGVTLSGGQKQRVAITRTLIKNSDILIFDDSLSAVDTETDAQIRAALKQNARSKGGTGATTFIISQRISTLMEADRIFVMENGKIADAGTHSELIARPGLYSRIWNIQNTLEEEVLA